MTRIYEVAVTRSGDWWAIEVTSGLPVNVLGVSQVRRLNDAQDIAQRLIADLLEADPNTIEINLNITLPADLAFAVETYRSAEKIETDARSSAAQMRSVAAATLVEANLTMRESGLILGLSHQRIKQLVDRLPEAV